MDFLNLAKQALEMVQQQNEANPDVKTASSGVFEQLKGKVSEMASEGMEGKDAGEVFANLKEKFTQVQQENEADPNQETADNSIFSQLQEGMGQMKEGNGVAWLANNDAIKDKLKQGLGGLLNK